MKTIDDVELATLYWVHWHNHQRLHGYCDDLPADYEQKTCATEQGNQPRAGHYKHLQAIQFDGCGVSLV